MNNPIMWNFEMVNNFFLSKGYSMIDINYINIHTKISIKDKNGYMYSISFGNFVKGCVPKLFHPNNPYTIKNIKLWCRLNNKAFELITDIYVKNSENLKWKCLKENCGETFKATLANILTNHGCGYCSGMQVSFLNSLAIKNPKLASEWHLTKNGDLTHFDVSCGSHKKVFWKCEKCKHIWLASVEKRNLNRGCPKCNRSKGEKRVEECLKVNDITFVSQYDNFKNLLSDKGNPLIFDFAIFEDHDKTNLKCLIEYDGEFHFKKQYYNDSHEKIKHHDELKNKYCINNDIRLIRISYWDFDNIEEILTKELQLT